jgi:hypothetical protein
VYGLTTCGPILIGESVLARGANGVRLLAEKVQEKAEPLIEKVEGSSGKDSRF